MIGTRQSKHPSVVTNKLAEAIDDEFHIVRQQREFYEAPYIYTVIETSIPGDGQSISWGRADHILGAADHILGANRAYSGGRKIISCGRAENLLGAGRAYPGCWEFRL